MKRIIRRILQIDSLGRVRAARVERLTDYENGTIQEDHATSVHPCEACGRPLEKIGDIRSDCARCGRSCCATCEHFCTVCHRPLCRRCRVGFSEKNLSACHDCLRGLEKSLARLDRSSQAKVAFERGMAVCGAQMKLLQLVMYSGDSISELIVQIRLARKLARLERETTSGQDHERRRLP